MVGGNEGDTGRAALLIELGKHEQAIRAARRALRAAPEDPEAHRLLAVALMGQDKLAQARTVAEAALALAPNNADVHSTLALILHRLGGNWEAREHHERAVALAPEATLLHRRYAAFLLDICAFSLTGPAELRAAWEHANAALRLDPADARAHLLRGEILYRRRRLAEAERSVRDALALDANDARAHEMLGDLYAERNAGAPAFACYREALRLDPGNEPLKRRLIAALESRLPAIGTFWRLGQYTGWHYRALWAALTALLSFVFVQAGRQVGFGDAQIAIYGVTFYLLILLWGLFLWVVDPLVTLAVLKGWIQID